VLLQVGQYGAAREKLEGALELWRRLRDGGQIAAAPNALGLIALSEGKVGPRGAWLKAGEAQCFAPAIAVDRVVDTTAAGDFWAAGFLYGCLHGLPLASCGRLGARLGGEVVREVGACLGDAAWERVREDAAAG